MITEETFPVFPFECLSGIYVVFYLLFVSLFVFTLLLWFILFIRLMTICIHILDLFFTDSL